jgi:hypothetical protein
VDNGADRQAGTIVMRHASLSRILSACLIAIAAAMPGNAAAQGHGPAGPVIDYLSGATDEDAADYLAFIIRAFGCEVRREDRAEFNDVILDFLAFDFGIELARADAEGKALVPEAVRQGLFAFSYRAGPKLVDRGELSIDREGTARLTTCNALTS